MTDQTPAGEPVTLEQLAKAMRNVEVRMRKEHAEKRAAFEARLEQAHQEFWAKALVKIEKAIRENHKEIGERFDATVGRMIEHRMKDYARLDAVTPEEIAR